MLSSSSSRIAIFLLIIIIIITILLLSSSRVDAITGKLTRSQLTLSFRTAENGVLAIDCVSGNIGQPVFNQIYVSTNTGSGTGCAVLGVSEDDHRIDGQLRLQTQWPATQTTGAVALTKVSVMVAIGNNIALYAEDSVTARMVLLNPSSKTRWHNAFSFGTSSVFAVPGFEFPRAGVSSPTNRNLCFFINRGSTPAKIVLVTADPNPAIVITSTALTVTRGPVELSAGHGSGVAIAISKDGLHLFTATSNAYVTKIVAQSLSEVSKVHLNGQYEKIIDGAFAYVDSQNAVYVGFRSQAVAKVVKVDVGTTTLAKSDEVELEQTSQIENLVAAVANPSNSIVYFFDSDGDYASVVINAATLYVAATDTLDTQMSNTKVACFMNSKMMIGYDMTPGKLDQVTEESGTLPPGPTTTSSATTTSLTSTTTSTETSTTSSTTTSLTSTSTTSSSTTSSSTTSLTTTTDPTTSTSTTTTMTSTSTKDPTTTSTTITTSIPKTSSIIDTAATLEPSTSSTSTSSTIATSSLDTSSTVLPSLTRISSVTQQDSSTTSSSSSSSTVSLPPSLTDSTQTSTSMTTTVIPDGGFTTTTTSTTSANYSSAASLPNDDDIDKKKSTPRSELDDAHTGIATTTSILSGVSGNPVAAQQAFRAMSMKLISDCGNSSLADFPLETEANPLGFETGEDDLKTYRSAVLWNLIFPLGFSVLVFLIAGMRSSSAAKSKSKRTSPARSSAKKGRGVYSHVEDDQQTSFYDDDNNIKTNNDTDDKHKKNITFGEAVKFARWPGILLSPVCVVIGPSTVQAVSTLFSYPDSSALDIGLSIPSFFFFLVVPLVLGLYISRVVAKEESLVPVDFDINKSAGGDENDDEREKTNNTSSFVTASTAKLKYVIFYMWVRPSLEWTGSINETDFFLKYGLAIDGYRHGWLYLFDYTISCIIAVSSGTSVNCVKRTCCRGVSILSLVAALSHTLCLIITRPYTTKVDAIANAILTLSISTGASLAVASSFGADVDEASDVVATITLIVTLVDAVLTFLPVVLFAYEYTRAKCSNEKYIPSFTALREHMKKTLNFDRLQRELEENLLKTFRRKSSSSSPNKNNNKTNINQKDHPNHHQHENIGSLPQATPGPPVVLPNNVSTESNDSNNRRSSSNSNNINNQHQHQPANSNSTSNSFGTPQQQSSGTFGSPSPSRNTISRRHRLSEMEEEMEMQHHSPSTKKMEIDTQQQQPRHHQSSYVSPSSPDELLGVVTRLTEENLKKQEGPLVAQNTTRRKKRQDKATSSSPSPGNHRKDETTKKVLSGDHQRDKIKPFIPSNPELVAAVSSSLSFSGPFPAQQQSSTEVGNNDEKGNSDPIVNKKQTRQQSSSSSATRERNNASTNKRSSSSASRKPRLARERLLSPPKSRRSASGVKIRSEDI